MPGKFSREGERVKKPRVKQKKALPKEARALVEGEAFGK